MKGREIIQKDKVPLLWLVVTSNSQPAWFDSVHRSDAILGSLAGVAWAAPAPVIEGAKSVKGREIVQNDQDPLLWLVVRFNIRPACFHSVHE